jgi:hypothetical protein
MWHKSSMIEVMRHASKRTPLNVEPNVDPPDDVGILDMVLFSDGSIVGVTGNHWYIYSGDGK